MRPAISWADLRNAEVGVWGLGVEGEASIRMLRTLGARVVLVDDAKPTYEDAEVLAIERGGLEALLRCHAVVKSPGISRYLPAAAALDAAGVPVLGGLGLWLQGAPIERVVAVTGTKGKSTTSAMLGHLLDGLGFPTFVGGNIGRPPYDPARTAGAPEPRYWVIETSSYQATDVAVSPPIVAVTSLHPDHLDWHRSVEGYYRDKLSLCTQPGARLTIASSTSPALVERASLLGPQVEWVSPDPTRRTDWHRTLGVRGDHNLDNAEIAYRCLRALGLDPDPDSLAEAARGFPGLEHRLQTVRTIGEVEFVDDSLSTNVLPTVRAIDAFAAQRTAVILGGFDRGIDYHSLGEALATREAPLLVLTIPASGDRIRRELADAVLPSAVEVRAADDLDAAVRAAYAWAAPRGVVLLSPAAPSFGTYLDYRQRAAAFVAAIDRYCVAAPG